MRVLDVANYKIELVDRELSVQMKLFSQNRKAEKGDYGKIERVSYLVSFSKTTRSSRSHILSCSMRITKPMAVIKPRKRARLKTASKKPKRSRPSRKVMSPTSNL